MTDQAHLPRFVEVTFHLPGIGPVVEKYDMLNINDMACWHANAGTYMQVSVHTIGTVTIPASNSRRIAAYIRLQERRSRQAKRLGLTLRTSAKENAQ